MTAAARSAPTSPFTNAARHAEQPSFQGGEAVAPSPTPPAAPAAGPGDEGRAVGDLRSRVGDAGRELARTSPTRSASIRRTAPVVGDFVVVDMRLFVGPESPPSEDKGYLRDIRRWYVKLYVDGDWSYQGRFIVEQRRFGRGVAAVAPVRHGRVLLAGLERVPVELGRHHPARVSGPAGESGEGRATTS